MDYRSRILIVDDDISMLEQLEQVLGREYIVSLAASGSQALNYLNTGNWVDLILLDILMPEANGYEVITEIRKNPRYEKTPVIFLTSLNDAESEVKGLLQGADYITKPCIPAVLRGRIERLLRLVGCLDREKLEQLPQSLSETEYFAAVLLAQGYSNEEIAQNLNYALGSVKNILVRVMNKLSIKNRKEIEQYMK
ncbi:MAG: DNA-binding response regulator [Blautia sp.]|nr:DNA-binding response regulator [Blautia sp.]